MSSIAKKLMMSVASVSNVDFVASITPPAGKAFNYLGGAKIDADGTVYQFMSTDETDAQIDLQLLKISPSGVLDFAKAYAFANLTGTTQEPAQVVLGGPEVKIVGTVQVYGTGIASVDSSGLADTPSNAFNRNNAKPTHATNVFGGNFWVAGSYRVDNTYPSVLYIVRVDEDTNVANLTLTSGTNVKNGKMQSLKVDVSGNLFGFQNNSNDAYNYQLFKVAGSGGASSWVKGYPFNFEAAAQADTNSAGYSAVVHTTYATGICRIDLLDPSGSLVWSKQHSTGVNEFPKSVYVDGSNNVYYTYGRGSVSSFLVKLDPSGNFIYRKSFSYKAEQFLLSGDDTGTAVVLSSRDYVVKANGEDFFTGTYAGLTVSNASALTLSNNTSLSTNRSLSFGTISTIVGATTVFTKDANPSVSISEI